MYGTGKTNRDFVADLVLLLLQGMVILSIAPKSTYQAIYPRLEGVTF